LLNSGRRQTLERWIEAVPETVRAGEPWLQYWLGVAQIQIGPLRGIEILLRALELFRNARDEQGQVLCLAGLINAAFLGFLALDSIQGWLDELLAAMEDLDAPLASDVELRVQGVLCSALFWVKPWHPATHQAARRVENLLAEGGDPNVALAASASALATCSMSGQFECGNRIALATRELVDRPGASPFDAAWWLLHVGHLYFNQARYGDALHYLRCACQIADVNGMRTTFTTTLLHRFMVEFRICGWTVANATASVWRPR
jgi:hypothetical protein